MNLEIPLVDYDGEPVLTHSIDIGEIEVWPQSMNCDDTRRLIRRKAGLEGEKK